jgi:eukaryotic-like serine/threonine-protein kinase
LRHTAGVRAVAFSPDGKTLASATPVEMAVRLWDIATGKQSGELLVNAKGTVCLAYSRDRRTLVTGGIDGYLRLWDVAKRQLRGEPIRQEGEVHAVAVSPDGHTVAASSRGSVWFWSVADRKQVAVGRGWPDSASYTLAFSPDGTLVATNGDTGSELVRLWDTAGNPKDPPLTGPGRYAVNLAFSPDGKTLATAMDDMTVRLWNVATRQPIGEPSTGHAKGVLTVAFSPDGMNFATGAADATVQLWRVLR